MKKYILIFLSVLWCSTLFGQNNSTIDSLQRLIKKSKNDTNKVNLLFDLMSEYSNNNPKKSRELIEEAGKLSHNLKYQKGIIRYNENMGFIYTQKSKYDSAIWHLNRVLDLYEKEKDSLNIGYTLIRIGERYNYKGDYENGLRYITNARKILDNHDIPQIKKAQIEFMVASSYNGMLDYKNAIAHGEKAAAIYKTTDAEFSLMATLNNLGEYYQKAEMFSEAEKTYMEALAICRKLDRPFEEVIINEGMANLMLLKNQPAEMKKYIDRIFEILATPDFSNIYDEMLAHQYLAQYYYITGNLTRAKEEAEKSLKMAESDNNTEVKITILDLLANISAAQHDFPTSLKYSGEVEKLRSGIFNENLAQKVADMRTKYDTEKKEIQIKSQQTELKQKTKINTILIIAIALLILVLALIYRMYRNRQKLQQIKIAELEKEKQLSAAQSLLKGQEEERGRIAQDLHDGLGGLLSGVKLQLGAMKGNLVLTEENGALFNRAIGKLDESISEMRRVAHNMMPEALLKLGLQQALQDYCENLNILQKLRINTEFHGLEQRMESSTEVIIYRIIQELLNNSIKHSGATSVLLQVMRQENTLSVTVEDNGKGFDVAETDEKSGIGLQNIRSRVNYLRGKIDIKSEPGKGTSVYMECEV
ncbi:MAG: sensor histidine kinase [Flavobacteriaceae bacterium]|nr:sensor histidine kinase [Flavobacteriaceae bacterium]